MGKTNKQEMKIKRSDFERIVELNKAYYKGDTSVLQEMSQLEIITFKNSSCLSSLVTACTIKSTPKYDTPLEFYYEAFELFGAEFED